MPLPGAAGASVMRTATPAWSAVPVTETGLAMVLRDMSANLSDCRGRTNGKGARIAPDAPWRVVLGPASSVGLATQEGRDFELVLGLVLGEQVFGRIGLRGARCSRGHHGCARCSADAVPSAVRASSPCGRGSRSGAWAGRRFRRQLRHGRPPDVPAGARATPLLPPSAPRHPHRGSWPRPARSARGGTA